MLELVGAPESIQGIWEEADEEKGKSVRVGRDEIRQVRKTTRESIGGCADIQCESKDTETRCEDTERGEEFMDEFFGHIELESDQKRGDSAEEACDAYEPKVFHR